MKIGTHRMDSAVKRLRIAVLNRHFLSTGGGAERYSMALVEQLAAQHEIHVFAQQVDHSWPGVTYHRVPKFLSRPRWLNQLWYATATWWQTRSGFDVVHSHENTWHGQVQTMHVLPIKYNLFVERQGWGYAWRWVQVLLSVRLLVYLALEYSRFSLKRPRTIVLASQTLVAQTLTAYPACKTAIQVITPGVDRVKGASTVAEKLSARKVLGLPESGYCIVFVGNDYRKKGLETLIQALKFLPSSSYVAVVGHIAQAPLFKAQAAAAGLENQVYFLGPLPDVSLAYTCADCLAHPTHEDTFAMVVLEALSHGLPVVVSSVRYCGIAALLQHEREALVLDDPRNAQALSQALLRLMNDHALVLRLQSAGLAFANRYPWSVLAQQQALIYQTMAAKRV